MVARGVNRPYPSVAVAVTGPESKASNEGIVVAHREHLSLLARGVEAWNERADDFWLHDQGADLSSADLRGATLSGANLFRADLSRADLAGALLDGAILSEANLQEANLRKANLVDAMAHSVFLAGADLTEAVVARAYLRDANMRDATLTDADLTEADLLGADLERARLGGSRLIRTNLQRTGLERTDLRGANLQGANLPYAFLSWANLHGANLIWANLAYASLFEADLAGCDLEGARMVNTDLRGADLTGCRVYGVAAWNVEIDESTKQDNLVVTPAGEPEVSVDRLEIAQFVYLLLTNAKIRDVIDTIGRKAVLILGRFTPERKAVLEGVRDYLRGRGYVPIVFDFEGPERHSLMETVSTLAHLSRFVIADLTAAASVRQEIDNIVRQLPTVPVQPLLLEGDEPYAMFDFARLFRSVLPIHRYRDLDDRLATCDASVIAPAEELAERLKTPANDPPRPRE